VIRLLLVGAGHAHAAFLAAAAKAPLYGARITLVTPQATQLYSGMLPGVVAGHYRLQEAQFDVARLAERSFAELVVGEVRSLDPHRRAAILPDGRELHYDVASLNVGSLTDISVPGSAAHAIAVKPFELFLAGLSAASVARVAVVGGGAAGTELAMAIRHRGAHVTLYSDRPAFPPHLAARLAAELRRRGVDLRQGMSVSAVEAGPVVHAGAAHQAFDLVVWTAGAAPMPWLVRSGLALDDKGFVLVDAALRSVSHPEVFAVGDCATLRDAPHAKAGVYAVRQGQVLEANLRKVVQGGALEPYRPQKKALVLLSCGARYAIAGHGNWSAQGRWVWWWKNGIDRRWIKRLAA
jgi:pyridine nucleotide-disulfide oxidoreductase family protein